MYFFLFVLYFFNLCENKIKINKDGNPFKGVWEGQGSFFFFFFFCFLKPRILQMRLKVFILLAEFKSLCI
jgi:hypothetical protein